MVAEYRTSRRLMARAAAITTIGVVPASSRLMTATWALPPKINGAAIQPAKVGMLARAALTPITSPNGTMPMSQGAIALAPASASGDLMDIGKLLADGSGGRMNRPPDA